jgi:hypothetical protein
MLRRLQLASVLITSITNYSCSAPDEADNVVRRDSSVFRIQYLRNPGLSIEAIREIPRENV